MNDLSNFVTNLHFLKNQIIVTSAVGGSWSYLRHNFLFFIFFVFLFYSDKREFVISCFSDCPFLFAIFCTILLLRFALVDMVSLTIIRLAFLRCAQQSVFKGKNLLLVKPLGIQKKLC